MSTSVYDIMLWPLTLAAKFDCYVGSLQCLHRCMNVMLWPLTLAAKFDCYVGSLQCLHRCMILCCGP